jgi:hypothetical protein
VVCADEVSEKKDLEAMEEFHGNPVEAVPS